MPNNQRTNRPDTGESPSGGRLNRLQANQKTDKVPFCPLDMSCGTTGFPAKNVGYPMASIYNDPEQSFWAQVWTQEQYCCDGSPIFGYGSYGAWEFGGEIKYPEEGRGQAPSVVRHPVESIEDVDRLELPDVKTSGMLPLAMLKAR